MLMVSWKESDVVQWIEHQPVEELLVRFPVWAHGFQIISYTSMFLFLIFSLTPS